MINTQARRRKALLEEEHLLHDRLAEITRRLTSVKATMQFYEDQLQATLAELSRISVQLAELNQQVDSVWQTPGYSAGSGNHIQG